MLAIVMVGPIARRQVKEIGKLEVMLMGLARRVETNGGWLLMAQIPRSRVERGRGIVDQQPQKGAVGDGLG